MRPPRLGDWLIARTAPSPESGENIRGDLHEEYIALPRGLRDLWYLWQSAWIAGGYLAARLARRDHWWRGGAGAGWSWTGRDLRHAVRLWRRHPGFAVLVVATLGLGIGATTAIVSVVDRVLLRPLPYPEPDELVTVWNTYPTWRGHEVLDAFWDTVPLSYPEYVDWRDGQSAFRSVAIYTSGNATLSGIGDPALIGFGTASSTLFPLLGVRPSVGRTFRADDEGAGGNRVAVVSAGFWASRLGATRDLSGTSIVVDGERYDVIGVLPIGFRLRSYLGLGLQTPDVWVPAGLFGNADDRGHHQYEAIARLAPGVSITQAEGDAGPLLRGAADPSRMGIRVLPRQQEEVAAARGPLIILLLAASVLMVIAGVNVATLFTAEAWNRRHEFATRRALGADGGQLARQLVLESGSLGLLGAGVGIGVAGLALPTLLRLAPPELALPAHVPLNIRMLVASALSGVTIGIGFGLVPSLLTLRAQTGSALNRRTVAGHRTTARLQRALIALEAALSIILLIGAALLGRSLLAMEAVDPGFQGENLVAVNLPLSGPRTQSARVVQLARDLVDRLGATPGVSVVTGANVVPFSGEGGSSSFRIDGRPVAEGEKLPEAQRRNVLPGFHETLGIPVVAGRTIGPEDREHSRPVVVVSQALAERYWPGESPIGEFIVRDNQRWEVVGIVGDVLHADLTSSHQSTFYFPFYQQPPNRFWMIVKSTLPPETLIPTLRREVTAIAPDVALGRTETLDAMVDQSTAPARYRAALIAVFGACALLLAAVGILGLTARMVAARRRELGIRIALGAHQGAVTRAVMATEASAMVAGIAAGLGVSFFAVRTLDAFLFGVAPYDPESFIGAGALLAVTGLLASYLPARRTAKLNPVEVLREE